MATHVWNLNFGRLRWEYTGSSLASQLSPDGECQDGWETLLSHSNKTEREQYMKTPAGLQFHIHRQSTSIYTETHTMHTCTTYTAHTHTHIYTTNSNIHSSHTRATHTHTAHAYTPHSICTYTYITHTVPAHGCIRTYMHTHTLTIWKSRDFIFKIVKETPDVFSVCFCSQQTTLWRTS